jgi:hypothetical protein
MRPAALLTLLFLGVVALGHLARLMFQVELLIDGVRFPMWPSAVAVVLTAGLAVWLWREQRQPGTP